ncbi:MAG: hypothetical protein KDA47_10985, partial [Planctomycetales bacterium]|nr:hypothetical protein [Planctomycetales bacterium]
MLGCESRWLSRLALASVAWAGLITSPLPAQQPPAGTLAEQPDDALPAAYPLPADRLGAAADEVRRRYPASLVRVSIDARNSQLLVVAPSVVQQDIRKFLASGGPAAPQAPIGATAPMPNAAANPYLAGLNAPPTSETPAPTPADPRPTAPPIPDSLPGDPTAGVPLANRLHTLAQLPPRDLEETLRRAWPSQLTFTPSADGQQVSVELNGNRRVLQIDRRAKTVRFEGPDEAVRLWRSLVETLDRPRRSTDEQIAITSLDKAEPETIRSALMMLRQAALRGGTLIEPAANGNRRFTGLASLIFQPAPEAAVPNPPAPNPQAPNPPAQPNPATNQPNPADADPEAADDPTDLEEGGSIGDVQLEFIPEFGVVVVKGNKRDVARVMRIIDQITQQSVETQPEVEVVLLQHINANAVATLVTDLYTQAFATRQTPVSIVSLDKPNALVLVGRPEAIASVKTILEKLDQPVPASTQLKIFRLEHMSAIDAEQTVRNFFVTNPGQGGNTPENLRPALGTKVRVIADYRTNSLIVQASSRDLEEVAFLLARLDIESTDATHVLRVFKLRNALAVDLATVLQQAISGVALSAAGAPQTTTAASTGPSQPVTTQKSTNLSIIGIDKAGNRLVQAGILNDVTVAADANINALVVRGPARAMDLMGSLIEQLDQMPDATSQIKVFELENGDATAMTAMLQQLFGQQVTAGQGVLNQFVQSQALSNLTGGAGAGDSSLIPLRFAIDQRTNAIIASGSAGDLQVVELLILRLDESGVEPRITNVVRLKNAPALDVATAISNFLVSQRAITQQQAQFTG